MGFLSTHSSRKSSRIPNPVEEVKMGIQRASTDPLSESSGSSSHRRTTVSMDLVRQFREHPPKIPTHLFHEKMHCFKMRKCCGMDATPEEIEGIKCMKKWNFQRATRPQQVPVPVGPMNETWSFDESELVSESKRTISSDPSSQGTEADGDPMKHLVVEIPELQASDEDSSGAPSPLDLTDPALEDRQPDVNSQVIKDGKLAEAKIATGDMPRLPRNYGYSHYEDTTEDSETDDDATSWYDTEWSIKPLAKGRGLSLRLGT